MPFPGLQGHYITRPGHLTTNMKSCWISSVNHDQHIHLPAMLEAPEQVLSLVFLFSGMKLCTPAVNHCTLFELLSLDTVCVAEVELTVALLFWVLLWWKWWEVNMSTKPLSAPPLIFCLAPNEATVRLGVFKRFGLLNNLLMGMFSVLLFFLTFMCL